MAPGLEGGARWPEREWFSVGRGCGTGVSGLWPPGSVALRWLETRELRSAFLTNNCPRTPSAACPHTEMHL